MPPNGQQGPNGPMPPNGTMGPNGPNGPPLGPNGLPGGPGPMNGQMNGSGGAMQDPTGFPSFHDMPSPPGPAPEAAGAFTKAISLAARPKGGYRPQVAVGPGNVLHAVYYDRVTSGDVIRYRQSADGVTWSAPEDVSPTEGRNWGPDLVVRPDGSVVIVYDHAEPDFRSRGWLRTRSPAGVWETATPLTPDGDREMGSGHVANATGEDLAYISIGKPLGEKNRFVATWAWRTNGAWSADEAFSDGTEDAWHTNVERRPDGSVLAGYDLGNGGAETTLYTVNGANGKFDPPENMTATSHPGERPHFAFPPGVDWLVWFHKVAGVPTHVYARSGKPGAWGAVSELGEGLGGFHFDPDIAVNAAGVLCSVWGWDAGADAELVYNLNRGNGWEATKKVADVDWGKPGLPSIDVDSAGAFHVVWNQGIRGSNEVYYAKLTP